MIVIYWRLSVGTPVYMARGECAYVPTALCSQISLAPLDPASLEPQHLVGIEQGLALTLTLTMSAMLFTKYCGKKQLINLL